FARVGLVASAREEFFGKSDQRSDLVECDFLRLMRDARELVAHAIERDVFGLEGDGVLERLTPARERLTGEAVHQIDVQARKTCGADLIDGGAVLAGAVFLAV